MVDIAKKIHNLLLAKRKTLATAESCTGGLLSHLITQNPGSSRYFLLGVNAYSNRAKELVLKIPHCLIAQKGAVSKEVTLEMAGNIRRIIKADFGIGITGIAGPSGATPLKPVGTVFIAVSAKKQNLCRKFILRGSRNRIKKNAALKSLELLKNLI
jgi:PncC family amidohydrolase